MFICRLKLINNDIIWLICLTFYDWMISAFFIFISKFGIWFSTTKSAKRTQHTDGLIDLSLSIVIEIFSCCQTIKCLNCVFNPIRWKRSRVCVYVRSCNGFYALLWCDVMRHKPAMAYLVIWWEEWFGNDHACDKYDEFWIYACAHLFWF